MRFTRINENTVNCIITAEDMDEQGLSIEDLFRKKDEAMAFLREIIARAAEEVDYRPNGSYLPMQMTVLPDQSISLTLSEDAGNTLAEVLRSLADRLRAFLEDIAALRGDADGAPDQAVIEERTRENSDEARLQDIVSKLRNHEFVFSFDSLRTVIRFAKSLSVPVCVKSSLYKDAAKDTWYLLLTPFAAEGIIVDIGEDNPDVARATLYLHANDYGTFVTIEKRFILHMQENMDCIIAGEALERLAEL